MMALVPIDKAEEIGDIGPQKVERTAKDASV
jgi:hypothetical protein